MWLLPAEKRCSQVKFGASTLGSAGRVPKVTRIVVLAKRSFGGGWFLGSKEDWRETSW